jgi:hypothetical protein
LIEWSDTQRYTSAPSVADENDIVLPTGMTFMQIFGMAGAVCESDHDSGSVVAVVWIVVGVFAELIGHPTIIPHINNEIIIITKFFIFVYVTKLASGIRTLGGLPITVARLCRILTGFPDCDAEIFIAYLHNCVK